MVTFTRFLYCYDEVKVNLLIELLWRKDFYKVIFWATEIFCSGFREELWKQIWRMYYEFYALTNSASFIKIKNCQKKYNAMKDKNKAFVMVLKVLNEMFHSEPTPDLFIAHSMYKNPTMNVMYKLLCKKIKNHYDTMNIKALSRNLYICVKKYPDKVVGCIEDIKIRNEENGKIKKEKVNINDYYDNMYLKLLAFLCSSAKLKKKEKKKTPKLKSRYSKYMLELVYFQIDESPDKVLKKWRKFEISDYTAAFKLERSTVDLNKCFRYNWLYFASNSPFWREKIEEYNGTINKLEKTIEFPNDDLYEDFYDAYNYDIDEIDLETQQKSTKQLIDLNTSDLLVDVFGGKELSLPKLNKKIENIKIKY